VGCRGQESGLVKEDIPKSDIINKVGHALHFLDPVFTEYSQSDKVKKLVRSLGYKDPVLPQSMYIFKQGRIGGEVTAHQDSTYLFTEPRQTCLGLWLALDDATVDNGCLWARKGSHREPIRSQLVRTDADAASGQVNEHGLKAKIAPQEINVDGQDEAGRSSARAREWLGKVPGGSVKYSAETEAALTAAGFVAVPVKAGDLVCFPGTTDHLSLANDTTHARHTFQLHLVEGPAAGVEWSRQNWMQYPPHLCFPSLSL
jgi:phytanoyl-CoA hydroxylase